MAFTKADAIECTAEYEAIWVECFERGFTLDGTETIGELTEMLRISQPVDSVVVQAA